MLQYLCAAVTVVSDSANDIINDLLKSDFFRCIRFNWPQFGSLVYVITPYFIFTIGPFHNFYTTLPAFHLRSTQPNPYTPLILVFRTHLCSYVCQAHVRTKMLVLLQVLIGNQYSLILQVDLDRDRVNWCHKFYGSKSLQSLSVISFKNIFVLPE